LEVKKYLIVVVILQIRKLVGSEKKIKKIEKKKKKEMERENNKI
jgi:hypothetical protein